jgi:hypothetical protein
MKFGAQFLGGWSGWGRGMLATIFVVAGALKVANSADFHSDLVAYQTGLPDSILRLIAVVLPWIEVLVGLALGADFWPETIRFLVVGLNFGFVLVLGQALVRGLDLRCGCFGPLTPDWLDQPPVALARASGLLFVSIWLWWVHQVNSPVRSSIVRR